MANSCGSATATTTITTGTTPNAGSISGTTTFCQGSFSPLTETVSGGVWTSSNTAVATVSSTGVVLGVSGGSATISYAIIGGCAPAAATAIVTISPFPNAGVITGSPTVCIGSVTTLADTASGGVWSSGDNTIATVSTSGVVTGVAAGTVNIYYSEFNGCGATNATVSLNVSAAPSAGTLSGNTTVCPGVTTVLTPSIAGGSWSSTNAAIASVDSTGTVTGVSSGSATISYSIVNACGAVAATAPVTVSPLANPGVISGTTTLCPGSNTSLSETVSGGTWSIADPSVASVDGSGNLTGIVAGSTTVSYSVTNSCGTQSATAGVTVSPAPSAGSITGTTVVCAGLNTTLSDASGGGTWASSNNAVATVNASGVVTGVAGGTANISYSVLTGCGPATTSVPVTVSTSPDEGLIIGATTICATDSIDLFETTPGGTWTSNNTAVATVNSDGVVAGISGGSVIISYTVSNGCGISVATADMIINPAPNAGTIVGTSAVCAGIQTTLADGTPGGIWSSSNIAMATVNSAGVVTGISAGTAVITYAVTVTCGTAYTTHPVTINALPNAGAITGITTLCYGNSTTLADTATGGVWTSSNIPVATVNGSGVVTSVSVGTALISYSISNMCGVAVATAFVTVNPLPNAGTITGASVLCAGSVTTMSETLSSGGSWSSSNNAVATVSPSGVVTGVAAGAVTISYTVTNSCASASATAAINVMASPATAGAIAGANPLCPGASSLYTDSTVGGSWSSSNTAVATVDASGLVHAMTSGNTVISYTVSNTCGALTTSLPLTVSPAPDAGSISAATTTVCAGAVIACSDAVSGGIWTSSDTSIATVNTGGMVTGVAAGSAMISYTVTSACGTAVATAAVNVNPVAAITAVSGPTHICLGNTATLTDGVFAGAWSSSDPAVATIDAATGVVTPVAAGTVVFTYTTANVFGCNSTAYYADTVDPAANAGTITATTTTVCPGSSIALSDVAVGGNWSSSDTSIAIVNAAGAVTGVTAGSATIAYTVMNAAGCSAAATAVVTVSPAAVVAPITGVTTICTSATATLTDAVFGGTWTSSTPAVATISTGGVLTALTAGNTTVSYTVTNVFGCSATATSVDTVAAPPVVPAISGMAAVCVGNQVTLANTLAGGTWTSNNTAIATVDASGIVTGISDGATSIAYTVASGIGCSTTVTASQTVNALPVLAAIGGPSGVCPGASITALNTTAGGTWTSGNTAIAAVNAITGVISGITSGVVTISYSYTNALGCSTTTVTTDTVYTVPVAGMISGQSNICVGASALLSSTMPGGVWSSSNNAISTVDASGNVTSVAAGIDTITYTVTNVSGCSSAVIIADTVSALPVVSAISGPSSICAGSNITLTNTTPGGAWTSGNASVATVSGTTGTVTGVTAGNTTISYTVSSALGCNTTVTAGVTVNALPVVAAIAGASVVCPAGTTSLTDLTAGGTWTSMNTAVATTDASGVVSGVAPGVDTILYTISNAAGCTAAAMMTITVNTPPAVAAIAGTVNICSGNSATLTDATAGGVWTSSDPATVSISTAGVINGVAVGAAVVTYSVTDGITGCSAAVTANETVNPLPVVSPISGPASICLGSMVTLSSTAGGVWSSSDITVAEVDPFSGVVAGVSFGSATITYTVTNTFGCSTAVTAPVSVLPSASVPAISGTPTACLGSSVSFSDAAAGGIWSSTNTAVATVNPATGVVTTVGAGLDTIVYTVTVSAGCTGVAVYTITTDTIPSSSLLPASGSATLCHGNPVELSVLSAGGGAGLSFQWYKNGVVIPGAFSSSYTADSAGSYTVTVSTATCSELVSGVQVLNAPHPVILHGTGTLLYTGSFSTYQWLFNGSPVSGANSSLYNGAAAGIYNVVVSDGNGCTDTSAAVVVSAGPSSVQVVTNAADIRIYPNPASSVITIDAPVKVNVAVLGMDGKQLIRQDDATSVNIGDLADGMYMIMIYDTTNKLLKADKFIKSE